MFLQNLPTMNILDPIFYRTLFYDFHPVISPRDVRMIRVSFQGFCEVQDGSKFPVRPEDGDHRLGPYSAFAGLAFFGSPLSG
jgi:hypothetical protein